MYEKVVGKGKKKEYPLCKTKARKEQKGTPSTWRRAKEWKKCCCKKPKPKCANCCKVCSTGKACGDTCIAKNLTCHKGAGCACNSRSPLIPEEARQP